MRPHRLLVELGRFAVRRPRTVLLLAAAVAVGALALAAIGLELQTSNLDLIDPELPAVQRFLRFADEFGTPNVLVVVFEGNDEAALGAAVDRAGARIRQVPGVRGVGDRLPYDPQTLADAGLEPYLASYDRTMFFAFVQPDDRHSSAETIAPFVEGVRRALAEARLDELGVHVGLTGMPEYALDDRDVIQHDISLLSLLSLGLVLLLFATGFHALRRPLLAVLALAVGVAVTLGLAVLYPGHLTLLSAFFASILFGLGIDFGIHVVSRVEELTVGGVAESVAVSAALESVGPALTTGALTTALVFFCMQISGFRGFAELGFLAGVGILVCLLSMVTVLPALLVLWGPRRRDRPTSPAPNRLGRLLVRLQSRPLAAALVTGVLIASVVGGPGFDTDYLNLQPRDSEAVRLEREMVRRSDLSPQFAVFIEESAEQAREISDRLLDDATVGEVHSIVDLEDLLGPGRDPAATSDDFLGALRSPAGRYAVYAYPAGDIWDPTTQDEFLGHMRALDPEVTGMPVLGRFMVDRSKRALWVTAVVGGLLLVACVGTDFRDPRLTVIAVLPTFATVAAMHGLMRVCGVAFNPLNVMALPVVIGIGVDDGVHIVHRFLEERGDLRRTLAGTGRSVLLTSLTTIAAFGSLAFTSHRGLASFAIALTLGTGAALVLSLLVLPTLLQLLGERILPRGAARSPVSAGVTR